VQKGHTPGTSGRQLQNLQGFQPHVALGEMKKMIPTACIVHFSTTLQKRTANQNSLSRSDSAQCPRTCQERPTQNWEDRKKRGCSVELRQAISEFRSC